MEVASLPERRDNTKTAKAGSSGPELHLVPSMAEVFRNRVQDTDAAVREEAGADVHRLIIADKVAGLWLAGRLLLDEDPDIISTTATFLETHASQFDPRIWDILKRRIDRIDY